MIYSLGHDCENLYVTISGWASCFEVGTSWFLLADDYIVPNLLFFVHVELIYIYLLSFVHVELSYIYLLFFGHVELSYIYLHVKLLQ
jgi:hypothetical protein